MSNAVVNDKAVMIIGNRVAGHGAMIEVRELMDSDMSQIEIDICREFSPRVYLYMNERGEFVLQYHSEGAERFAVLSSTYVP